MEISVENMCRTCMNDEGSMLSVYDMESRTDNKITYAEMLMSFASIKISAEDDLPKQICQFCLKQIILAFNFKQTTERSDAMLREITRNPEIEFIKQEITDSYSEEERFTDSPCTKRNELQNLSEEFLEDEFQMNEEEENVETLNQISNDNTNVNKPIDNIISDSETNLNAVSKSPIKQVQKLKTQDTINNGYLVEKSSVKKMESNLKSIIQKHYECPLCKKRFVKFETFKKHKSYHALLKCEQCEKEFRSTHGLRYHMKIHSGVKNFACTFENCSKRFRLKQALDKHISVHNNEKNHLCPICGKTYAQYDALHYHIRTHSGERPYLCVHCGKTFKQSCHLKNHMWNHTGIKPHKCKTCGKCYTAGHQLKKHLRKYCNNPLYQASLNSSNANDDKTEIIKFKIEDHSYDPEEISEQESIKIETFFVKCE